MTRRILILAYGVLAYAATLATLVYLAGFVGGMLTPTQLDGPREGSLTAALVTDLGLLVLFALQHSGMARPGFKRWLTRFVPGPAERSTYCLLSSAALFLLFWLWQPIGGTVWDVPDSARPALYAVFAAGWVVVLAMSFLINHFDLFGLRQVWLEFRGVPYTALVFKTPGPYRVVRHPLYVGLLMAFWAAPTMTAAHLVFALGMTAYILMAIRWEERDLETFHPEYAAYRRRVGMLLPKLRAAAPAPRPAARPSPVAAPTDVSTGEL
jgi:protein-S-isoprenylcysteine O-methyltransferase Ste14